MSESRAGKNQQGARVFGLKRAPESEAHKELPGCIRAVLAGLGNQT